MSFLPFSSAPPIGTRGSKWMKRGSLTHSGNFCVVGVKGMGVVWGVVAELVAETPKHVLQLQEIFPLYMG